MTSQLNKESEKAKFSLIQDFAQLQHIIDNGIQQATTQNMTAGNIPTAQINPIRSGTQTYPTHHRGLPYYRGCPKVILTNGGEQCFQKNQFFFALDANRNEREKNEKLQEENQKLMEMNVELQLQAWGESHDSPTSPRSPGLGNTSATED